MGELLDMVSSVYFGFGRTCRKRRGDDRIPCADGKGVAVLATLFRVDKALNGFSCRVHLSGSEPAQRVFAYLGKEEFPAWLALSLVAHCAQFLILVSEQMNLFEIGNI